MKARHAATFPRWGFGLGWETNRHATARHVARVVVEAAAADAAGVCRRFGTQIEGITDEEAERRLAEQGPNVLAEDRRTGVATLVAHAVLNPLVILLAALAAVSFVTGDVRAGGVMLLMITLGAGVRLVQEARADDAAARLKAMISVRAPVVRGGHARELPVAELVPGDVVTLAAGDMIPADVRLVAAKDLFVNQAALTGESVPVEKFAVEARPAAAAPGEFTSVAFLGTSVESGSGTAVVVATGRQTYLGGVAGSLVEEEPP
ncbi:MAG: cation-transporting P-type ATPase, partial [Planctomycetia bacterium]